MELYWNCARLLDLCSFAIYCFVSRNHNWMECVANSIHCKELFDLSVLLTINVGRRKYLREAQRKDFRCSTGWLGLNRLAKWVVAVL